MEAAITKKRILVVDDETDIVKLIAFHMSIAGYDVLIARDGFEALQISKEKKPSLIILDIMLPKMDGWEVCRHLRRENSTSSIPIIMLSALSETNDKLRGFDQGADDYMTKPFSPRELVVRVKRVLARSEARPDTNAWSPDSLRVGLEDLILRQDGLEITLTEKEKGILKLFMDNPKRVLSHSEILDKVWGQDNIVEYGNIDVHIRHLREKIEKDPGRPRHIRTVKAKGYKYEP